MNVLFYEYILRMAISCYSLYLECTDNILYRLITVSVKIVIYSFYHFHCNRRINEVCRTNLDGRGTCKHEFHSIFPVHDTSQAYDGDFTALATCHTIRKAMGFTAAPDMPPGYSGEYRTPAFRVYSHSQQGIDEGNTVCTAIFGCAGYFSDVGNVRGELYDKCLFVNLSARLSPLLRRPWR